MSDIVNALLDKNKYSGSAHLQDQRKKFFKRRLIMNILNNTDLSGELSEKVQWLVTTEDVLETTELTYENCVSSDCVLLGLHNINNHLLNYEEKNILKASTEKQILSRQSELHGRFSKLLNDVNKEENERALLKDFKKQLNESHTCYLSNLNDYCTQLEEVIHIRRDILPDIIKSKLEEYKYRKKIQEMKYKCVQNRTRIFMFMESTKSLAAYEELLKDILDQQSESQQAINNLNALKERYAYIKCKQFDTILNTYRDYCIAIEKKMFILQQTKQQANT